MQTQIITQVSINLTLALVNCRENMGHDDSLPYQAEIFYNRKGGTEIKDGFQRLGTVCNDGWGGMSMICLDRSNPDSKDIMEEIRTELLKHTIIYDKHPLGPYTPEFLLDTMAEGVVGIPPKKGFVLLYQFGDSPVVKANGGNEFSFIKRIKIQ